MCIPADGLYWDTVSYGKHTKVTKRSWDRSFAQQASEEHGSHAQYNPHIPRQEIERIEMACTRGTLGKPLGVHANSGSYYYTHTSVIGVSKGEFTNHIIVFRQSNGSVHGYPIPDSELREKQRKAGMKKATKKRKNKDGSSN